MITVLITPCSVGGTGALPFELSDVARSVDLAPSSRDHTYPQAIPRNPGDYGR